MSDKLNTVSADGVQAIAPQTAGFTYNHTMLRVKDPKKSLGFYTGILGMTLLRHSQYPDAGFDLYFLAKLTDDEQRQFQNTTDVKNFVACQRGILELTHNYGSENDTDFSYHNGNSEPRGFGHICFSVPDLAAAVAWFDQNNVIFQKRPEDGSMRDIAFIKDPDGYWIEIIEAKF